MSASKNSVEEAHKFELANRAHSSVTEDPFYAVPKDTSTASPGTLLKVERETDTSLYTLAPNLSLSRFMYQSKTSNGTLVPVSAYILWPYLARDYGDGLPSVIWAHGTSGVNDECAPSNIKHLWHHFQAPYQLALLGYVVVATDYAGLGVGVDASGKKVVHEYLNGAAHANDVAYSIPAAQEAFPELSRRFVVMGSSQGGLAAWGFAEKLIAEPMPGHLGTIALHPVTRVLSLPMTNTIVALLMINVAPSLLANYPNFKLEQIFTESGQEVLEKYQTLKGCNNVLSTLAADGLMKEHWRDNLTVQQWQDAAAIGGKPISGPMMIIQGVTDGVVGAQSVEDAIDETMKMDPEAHIQYHSLPNISHAPAMYAGLQLYTDWIAARFAEQPFEPGLLTFEHCPVRPAEAQQPKANWFIQQQIEPWQAA